MGNANAGGVIADLIVDQPVVGANTCDLAEEVFRQNIDRYAEHYAYTVVSHSQRGGESTCFANWTLDINNGHIRKVKASVKFAPSPHSYRVVLEDVTS